MTFDATYRGKVYSLVGGTLYKYGDGVFYGTSAVANFDGTNYANGVTVVLTGYSVTSSRGSVGYQTTTGRYILLQEGWQAAGSVSLRTYSESAANAIIRKLINNNIAITQNNLVCARYASRFTEEQQQLIRDLQNRVVARQNALTEQGLCDHIQTSYPKGYADLEPYLAALMNGDAIGIATWAVVVIAAVVIAGFGTAAYFAYRALYDESEQDVKWSKELTAILAQKLTPEEYEQLKAETQGIVTRARIRQAIGSYWDALRIAALGVGVYALYRIIKNRQQ